jgi:hypothetical protein
MKCKLRLLPRFMNLWLLNLIPYDELGKATHCQTEGFAFLLHIHDYALMMWCCEMVISTWWLKLCSESVVLCCVCLLMVMAASSLPFPPGSAPGLSFSSRTCCWSLVLLLLGLVLSFSWTPWFCSRFLCDAMQELVLFLVWCARTVVFLRWCSAGCVSDASPGDTHQVGYLALLAAMVLPAASLS